MAKVVDISGKNNNEKPSESIGVKKSCTVIRSANKRLEDARSMPPIRRMFDVLVASGELTLVFADTKVGKTIHAVQLANDIAYGRACMELYNECEPQRVLYYDFELSDKQYEERYLGYTFSDNLLFGTLTYGENTAEFSVGQIEEDVEAYKCTVVVIDNIMALSANSLSDTDVALKLMQRLDTLKRKMGVTVIVLSHTNKIPSGQPLHRNHLAGAKFLQNYCDTLYAIGESSQAANKRYIKHLFSRSGKLLNQVLVCDIIQVDNQLCFASMGFDDEQNHLQVQERTSDQEDRSEETSFWLNIFKGANQLSFTEAKNRIILTGLGEQDAKNKIFRSKVISKLSKGIYGFKGAETPGSGSGSAEPLSFEPSEPMNLYTKNGKSTNGTNGATHAFSSVDTLTVFESEQVKTLDYYKNIAREILYEYPSRGKIFCVKAIVAYTGLDENEAYVIFEKLLCAGLIKDLGDDSYSLI